MTWIESFGAVLVCTAALLGLINLAQLVIAAIALSLRGAPPLAEDVWGQVAGGAPSVSLLVPAYNEEATIVTSLNALLVLEFPDFEVIVINDGSRDTTLVRLIENFALYVAPEPVPGALNHQALRTVYRSYLYPRLTVIDKANGGKADALNAGLNRATSEFVCVIDADSVLDRDALLQISNRIMENRDEVVAVGGAIRVANGCVFDGADLREVRVPKHPLALFQALEYMRAFMINRVAMGRIGSLNLISGAFGVFARDIVMAVGGYAENTVGEDFELGLRIQRRLKEANATRSKIAFAPDAVCWTQVPTDLKSLSQQRRRWQRGSLETLWRHRYMMADRRYGAPAFVGMAESILSDIIVPAVEVLGLLVLAVAAVLGHVSWMYFCRLLCTRHECWCVSKRRCYDAR